MSDPEAPERKPSPTWRGRLAEGWTSARSRLSRVKLKRPSRKALVVTGSIVGGLVLALALFLALFDWNYLRGPISRLASDRLDRPVAIEGDLDVKLLSWSPTATVHGLRIGNPPGYQGDLADIQKLTVSVRLAPLFRGKVILPRLQADQPNIALIREANGANNWTFKGKSPGEPARLPAIRHFEINQGKLRIDDRVRRLEFAGTVSSSEIVGAQRVEGFRLRGDGTLNREPFKLNLTGGPLINVDPDRPYPFNADVRAGPTTILAKGSIARPFDLGEFRTDLTVRGPDMADLYYLTGLTLPNTPPYNLSGLLTRNDRRYRYNGINGTVGDSDLHGWLGVQTGERLMLTGDLTSRRLDFDDLATLIGAAPSIAPGEAASPAQVKVAQNLRAQRRLLPDTPLHVDRLRRMDADVRYRADSIRSEHFPVRRGSVHVELERGLLKLNDLTFGLTRGEMAGAVAINARQATPIVDLDMRMTGARIEQFLPARFADNAISGGLVARAKLRGTGKSVRQAAATADGTVTLVSPRGEIREAFAELLGVNVVRGLGLLLAKNQDKTEIRCAVAAFEARNGVLHANRILFDTGPVLARGSGSIDLRTERMDLRIKGEPKEFRLVRLMLPITVEGPITGPKLGVEADKAVGQLGLAAAIGSVFAPLAAILPFVDTGLAKDANCAALVQNPNPAPAKTAAEPAKAKPRG